MAKKNGNGEGTIYKRADGKWEAKVTVGRDAATGKLKRRSLYGNTRKEVADKLTELRSSIGKGTYVEDSQMTVGEWLKEWLYKYKKSSIKPSTFESYEMFIRLHINPHIGDIKIQKLRTADLQNLYNEQYENGRNDGTGKLSVRSIERIHMIVHQSLEQAVREGLITKNVSKFTTRPRRVPKEMRVFTLEEQEKFLQALEEEKMGFIFLFALGTGLRRGEILGLRWREIDLENGHVKVRNSLAKVKDQSSGKRVLILQDLKTAKSRRTVPLPGAIKGALKAYKKKQNEEILAAGEQYNNNDLVFCTAIGTPMDPRNFNRMFYRLVEKAGIDHANPHCLRHTYATRLLENENNPKVAQELLGHAKVSTTLDIYTHVMPETKQAAVDKLNDVLSTKKVLLK